MHLYITGFLANDSEDSSLKYDFDVAPEYERAVMDLLRWKSLAEDGDGEFLLSDDQTQQISTIINQPLPAELDLFISVVRD